MTSMANAEAEKLFEGVYRDVNIALANELSDYCEQVGVNYWDARKGANHNLFAIFIILVQVLEVFVFLFIHDL